MPTTNVFVHVCLRNDVNKKQEKEVRHNFLNCIQQTINWEYGDAVLQDASSK